MAHSMDRRRFISAGLTAGAGALALAQGASAQIASGHDLETSRIAHTDGQRLDTALYGLAQSALPADRPALSGVMPAVTIGAANAGSTIASPQYHSPGETKIFAGRALPNAGYPNDFTSGGAVSYVSGLYAAPNATYEWMVDGSQCGLLTVGRGGIGRILIDGVAVYGPYRQPADGNPYSVEIDFGGSRAIRRITLQTSYGFGVWYIVIGPNDTLWQSPRQLGPRCIVMGDSFTEGTGANFPCDAYPAVFGKLMGWEDTWASGSGGTGYLSTIPGRYTFRQRVQSDVIAFNPSVVVIAGGTNDGNYTSSQVQAEATLLYQEIFAALPNVRLFALGPWRPRPGVLYQNFNNVDNGIQAAVAAVRGTTFIDVSNYFSGSGYIGGETGAGNCDYYISGDAEHPSTAGHLYLGQRLAADLAALQPF